ncbi:MAG: tetratricopeptide (TPR) repeat protein [Pseudohongiellaceae bacterium]|jgi:tetratricopeptide (TPR) repeat protein
MRLWVLSFFLCLAGCIGLPSGSVHEQPEQVAAAMAAETEIALEPSFEAFRPVMLVERLGGTIEGSHEIDAFAGRDADVRDVLAVLFAGGDLEFVVAGDVQGDVSFEIHRGTRPEAFLELLRHVGLSMTVAEGRAVISSRERRRFDVSSLGLPLEELLVQLRALLDPEGYGVFLPDGRIEVESTAAAMENVVAWLDGQLGFSERLPFRFALAEPSAPAPKTALKVAKVSILDRHELSKTLALIALNELLDERYFSAGRHLADALALDPSLHEAHLASGWQNMLQGDHGAAQLSFERAITARHRDRLGLTLQALNDLAVGRFETAVRELKRANAQYQDGPTATNLAGALYLSGQPDHALAAAQAQSGAAPDALHMLRAWLFVRADWVEAAVAELDKALLRGARMDDEGWEQILAAIHFLKEGYIPPEPGGPLLVESAASVGQTLKQPRDVRDEYDASWH